MFQFIVTLTPDKPFEPTDAQRQEMADYIESALVNEAETNGLMPEDSEAYTKKIEVKWATVKTVTVGQ